MTAAVFTDVERPIRDWLRSAAISGISRRVYVGLPGDTMFPAIEMTLLDGGIQPGDAPVCDVAVSFSVWGADASQRNTVADAAWALASLLHTTNHAQLDGLVLLGARVVSGPVPRYDADGTPRYVLDAAITVRVTA